MKKQHFKWFALLLMLPLLLWAGYQIRVEHYPLNIQPSDQWEGFVSNLNADRESYFVNSDGVMLEAELFVPRNGRSAKPAVVFSPGSGDSLYQNYSPDMIETAVLDLSLQRDIAVLLVNKRGMGASEGNWYKNDFQGRADDLYTAVSTLHNHPMIDANQIGLIGHSQGGWIVQLAAAQHPDIAFFISLAGPITTYQTQGLDMYTHIYPCEGYTGAALENKVNDHYRLTRLGAALGHYIPFGMLGFDAGVYDYDPLWALQTVQSPGLLLFGEHDFLVTPSWNLERMDQIFYGNPPANLQTATISGVNHGFRIVEDSCAEPAETISPELLTTMNSWLDEQGF
ncbi:MAG: alpha/beta fold hydrolase [Ardenticatenaceae bacterium]|nr:alpha/beta fold hydrolase [Ardenticatenaceae bacterium]